ncbi:MAG: YbhB/YbcL family Raf kinase inhibitor-like protein [Acidobacteriota bacterium]
MDGWRQEKHRSGAGRLFKGWLLAAVVLAGCSIGLAFSPDQRSSSPGAGGSADEDFSLSSPAFKAGEEIPPQYSCDGAGLSPALRWTKVPSGTKSLALVVDDPDAPDPAAPKVRWVHWILYNLPPSSTGLPRGVNGDDFPPGTLVGRNGWGRQEYGGPCPPRGRHRYVFKLYALKVRLPDLSGPDRETLESAMQGHILATTRMVGLYRRHP